MGTLFRGGQMHLGYKRSTTLVNISAPLGLRTQIPIILGDKPASRQAVRVYFGPPGGPHHMACLGTDFDVSVELRAVYWLPTARWPLNSSELIVDYYTQGITA